MNKELINYEVNGKTYEGLHAKPDSKNAPCILIAHTWAGRDVFVEGIATKLAEDGYNAFAIDMYGDGKVGNSNEENQSMMQPLLDDRKNLSQVVIGAYEAAKKLEEVDNSKIAIMGYCFGGLVSLDLARSGVDLKGAASFHGFLSGSEDLPDAEIQAKLLVLHGHLDPMVGLDQIESFTKEMDAKSVDWQLHAFGNAMHAFTNPEANDPSFGTVYSSDADQRSWKIFKDFLSEIFS